MDKYNKNRMKYKYTGSDEKHFPTLGVTVKNGDVIETDKPVNHAEFEEVKSESQKKREEVQKKEDK